MLQVNLEDTILAEMTLPGGFTRFRNFVGAAGTLQDSPQAYLVYMPDKGTHVPPHFHDIDQFQVALSGRGTFGKKPWRPGGVQYADAFKPYGPIVADDGGLAFYTLRVASSSGQYDVPGSKHLRANTKARFARGDYDLSQGLEALPKGLTELIEPRGDGLGAWGIHLSPGESFQGPDSDAGGQYYIVEQGSMIVNGSSLSYGGLLFLARGEEGAVIKGGPDGAALIIVSFPQPSDRPGSDPAELSKRELIPYAVVGAKGGVLMAD